MSPLEIIACVSPAVPALLLVLTLYGPWYGTAMPPLQFAVMVGEGVLAAAAHHTLPQAIATAGFVVAFAGLVALVLRDRWVEHRTKALIDWERFERDLRSYATSNDSPRPNEPESHS